MEKRLNSRLTPEQQLYIKQMLYKDYAEAFENNGIHSIEDAEICDLAEFLITMDYDKALKNETIYRNNENMQRIYVIKNKGNIKGELNRAVLINTNENGKEPKGEFGVYDFDKNQFETYGKTREYVVKQLGIAALNPTKQDEIINVLFNNELEAMDKLSTIDLEKMIEQKRPEVEKIRDKAIDETNAKNGISKESREEVENKVNVQEGKNNKDNIDKNEKNELPEDVKKACQRLGITNIKSYFYVNANQFNQKIDNTRTNINEGKVLILEVPDSSKIGSDRYFGMQNERLVLWGNEDKAVSRVMGPTPPKDGKYIEPLKENNPTYVEFENSDGLVINEKLEDKSDVSIQDKMSYKEKIEELLDEYSKKVMSIESYDISPSEKQILLKDADKNFDIEFMKISEELGIAKDDVDNIKNMQDKNAIEEHNEQEEQKKPEQEEIDAWEVPGRLKRGE